MLKNIVIFLLALTAVLSCARQGNAVDVQTSQEYAALFDIVKKDSLTGIVVIQPKTKSPKNLWSVPGRDDMPSRSDSDTMWFEPMDRLICMSSSHVAALSAIGADKVIMAVSGLKYMSDPDLKRNDVKDIGYDAALDYEAILALEPDLLVTYAVTGAEPAYVSKLRSLGVRTLVLHDHLEQHPLARAEYVRLFGALTGRNEVADSVYGAVRERYLELTADVDRTAKAKVLINIPYGDAWYVPGREGYMSQLVRDAGGEILGAVPDESSSSVVSLEQAYEYSLEADLWLNPGSCGTREELAEAHHMFPRFGPMAKGLPIYNNIRCVNEGGGNDFWESGAVRPDLILEDLISIMNHAKGGKQEEALHYHVCL